MCKFKVGDKVKTRNGTDVEIVCVDERAKQPIIGLVFWTDGEVTSISWYEDGAFLRGRNEDGLDLIPPSRTVTLYQALVLSPDGYPFITDRLYGSGDSEALQDFSGDGYKVVRLLTEYPIEVEL